MNSSKLNKIAAVSILTIIIAWFGINPLFAAKTTSPESLPTAYQSLQALSLQEKQVVGRLFALSQSIESSQEKITALSREQVRLKEETEALDRSVKEAQQTYEETRNKATSAVRYLQRLGPVSYMEIVAGSSSLEDFWQRLNLLSSSLGGIDENLTRLKNQRDQLLSKKEALLAKDQQLQTSLSTESAALAEMTKTRQEQEAFLAGLGVQRQGYEEILSQLEKLWLQDTLPYLNKVNEEISVLLAQGDYNNISWFPTKDGLSASIPLSIVNAQLQTRDSLQGIVLIKEGEQLRLQAPDRSLELLCNIVIKDSHSLVLIVDKAWLAGIPLSQDTVWQFQAEPIRVSFGSELGFFRLHEFHWEDNNFVLLLSF